VPPDAKLGPWLIFEATAQHPEQPWKGHGLLGELIALACLRDVAKVGTAIENLGAWLDGPMPLASIFEE